MPKLRDDCPDCHGELVPYEASRSSIRFECRRCSRIHDEWSLQLREPVLDQSSADVNAAKREGREEFYAEWIAIDKAIAARHKADIAPSAAAPMPHDSDLSDVAALIQRHHTYYSVRCKTAKADVCEDLLQAVQGMMRAKVMPNTHAVPAAGIPGVTADTRSDTRDYQALALAEQAERSAA